MPIATALDIYDYATLCNDIRKEKDGTHWIMQWLTELNDDIEILAHIVNARTGYLNTPAGELILIDNIWIPAQPQLVE